MAEEEVKSSRRSLLKVFILGINVLIFLSGVAFFLLTKYGLFDTAALGKAKTQQTNAALSNAGDAGTGTPEAKTEPPPPLLIVPMHPFVVNLSGDKGRRYLRLRLKLGVENDEAKAEIDKALAHLRNELIFLLSAKTLAEVNSIQGKYQLQDEISRTLNKALGSPLVKQAYFTEFIVQ